MNQFDRTRPFRGRGTATSLLLPLLCAAALCAAPARAFTFASDGKAAAVIVQAPGSVPSAALATRELKTYLEKMTGGLFQILAEAPTNSPVILVGAPYASKRTEEICIREVNPKLLEVTGEGTRGPIYAAYRLLEELGCGFWSPWQETVPSSPTLSLPAGYRKVSAPAFEYRQVMNCTIGHTAWEVKVGINGDMWCGGVFCLSPEQGGNFQMDMGESMAGVNGRDGEQNFKAHPEWFAWIEKTQSRNPLQLCLSNKEAIKQIIKNVRAQMARAPKTRYISVSMMDDDHFCQCRDCMKGYKRYGGLAGLVIHVVNQVARDVAKDYPDLSILYLAYWTPMPPTGIKPEPNVAVSYARLGRNYARPLFDDDGARKSARAWSKYVRGNVFAWGYNAQFRGFMLPTPTLGALKEDMLDFQKVNFRGFMYQMSSGRLADFAELRAWLFAKLAWDPAQDDFALASKWCDGACGAGAPYMKKWLAMRREIRKHLKYYPVYQSDCRPTFKADALVDAYVLFQKALEATKDDAKANALIRRQYASILTAVSIRYNFDILKAAKKKRVALPERAALFDELEALCKQYGQDSFGEGCSIADFLTRAKGDQPLYQK